MRIAILGFGREGQSLLKFFKKSPQFHGAEIKILDQKFDKNYLENLGRFNVIFRSPGVPYTLPEIQKAKKSGVKISSATKLFFEQLHGLERTEHRLSQTVHINPCQVSISPCIIGVTGTKGKGTTSLLLYQILKNSGFKAVLAGNIGKPMLDSLKIARRADFAILELSSFQLQDLTRSPDIAVVLDIFPDHLDAHKNLKEYYGAKTAIGRYQKQSDAIFYFADNHLSKKIALASPAKKITVYPKENGLRKNFEMAAAIAKYLGCPAKIIEKTMKNFKGLEHRLELVRTIKYHTNILKNVRISFYNDSAATNPQTTAMAIRSFSEPTILITGGRDAKFDYRIIGAALKTSSVKKVILFGENKHKVARQIKTGQRPIEFVKTLSDAVHRAYRTAQASRSKAIVVLFSPGAKSFDMFKNYADRGKKFKALVKSLKNS